MAGEHIDGFTIDLGIDTSDVDRGMANLQRKLKTADAQMKANLSTFNKAEKSVDRFETQLDGLNKSMTQQARAVDKSKEKLDRLKDSQDKTTKALKDAGIEADKAKQKHERLTNEYEDINKVLKEHKANVKSAQDAQKQMQNTVTALSAKTKNAKSSLDSLSNELKELEKDTAGNAGEISDLTFEIGRAEREYKKLSTSLDGATRDLNESKAATASAKNELENFSNANKEAMASAKTAMSEAKKQADSAERSYAKLNREVGALPAKLDKAEKEVYEQALAYNVLQNRIDETTDELKELNRQQTFFGKMSLGIKSFDERWQAVNAKINKIGDSFRNVGYVAQGVINGILIQNISTIIPVAGAATSAVAGIGGAAVAAVGGAIGLAGVYGTALGGISIFAGMAASSLKRLEDGTLKITGEVTRYQGALESLKNTWNGLADRNQANIFNTITNGIRIAILSLQRLTPAIDSISGIISKASLKMFEWVQNSKNANQVFTVINSTAPPIFQNLVNAIMKVTDGLAHMIVQFAPLFTWVGAGIESLATKFSKWANSASTDSSTAKFIQYTKTNLPIVGAIFGNIFGGIIELFKAFSGHSHTVLIGMQNVTKTFKEWGQSLSSSDKFKAFIDYLNTNGPIVWQLLKNIGSILVGLVQGMAPIGAIMLKVTTSITGFISKIVNSSPAVGAFIGILAAIVGGLMALVPPIALARTAFGGLGGAAVASGGKVGLMSKALGVLRGAFTLLLGPWGIAIAALVGGFVLAYKHSETFRNIVNKAFDSVKNGITVVVNYVKPMLMSAFNAIKTFGVQIGAQLSAFWQQNGATIIQALKNIGSVVGTIFRGIWAVIKFVMPAVKLLVVSVWNNIKGVITGALNIIMGAVKLFSSLLTGNWRGAWNGLVQILKGAVTLAWNLVQLWFVGKILKVVKGGLGLLRGVVTKGWTFIKNFIGKTAQAIWNGVRTKFTGMFKSVRGIFTNLSKFSRNLWTSLKNKITSIGQSIWTNIRNKFNGLSKSTRTIFSNLSKFARNLWTNLKNKLTSLAQSIWNNIRNKFNGLSKSVRTIFSNLSKWSRNLWSALKNSITKLAQNIWTNVRNKFSGMFNSVRNILNKLLNTAKNLFTSIKNRVTSLAHGARDNVVNGFKSMYDKGKSWINKLKGFLGDSVSGFKSLASKVGNGIANGAIGGLNKMIDGVNWLSKKIMDKKLIKDKIQRLSTGTGGSGGVKTNSKGQLQESILAMVNDKGRGNGKGSNGHQELIRDKDGSMYAPKGRNVVLPLRKGMEVINGKDTQKMFGDIPKFSAGSGTKSRKKKPSAFMQGMNNVKDVLKASTDATVKTVSKKGGELAGEGAAKAKEVWDYVENPGKLVQMTLDKFGVDFSGIKGVYGSFMKHGFAGLKKGLVKKVMSWFDDAGGYGNVDGSSILKHGISYGYSPNKPLAGYPLSINGGRHYGIDTPHINEKIQAPTSGIVRKQYDPGGGTVAQLLNGKIAQYYLHLSDVLKTGRVKQGDTFARTGNSGANTTGAHLHTQIEDPASNALTNSNTKDPVAFLKSKGGSSGGGGGLLNNVRTALKIANLPVTQKYINAWMKQIQTESGGNARAIGGTDGLADGRAQGLVQVKPGTFNAYKGNGMGNIFNPIHNLVAGMNYSKSRYGKGGLLSVIGRGHGYATGGLINQSGMYNLAEGGYPEYVIPTDPKRRTDAMKLLALAGQDIQRGKNKRPNQLKTPKNNSGSDDSSMLKKVVEQQSTQINQMSKAIEYLAQIVTSNQKIADNPVTLDGREMNRNNNEQQAINMATSLMGR